MAAAAVVDRSPRPEGAPCPCVPLYMLSFSLLAASLLRSQLADAQASLLLLSLNGGSEYHADSLHESTVRTKSEAPHSGALHVASKQAALASSHAAQQPDCLKGGNSISPQNVRHHAYTTPSLQEVRKQQRTAAAARLSFALGSEQDQSSRLISREREIFVSSCPPPRAYGSGALTGRGRHSCQDICYFR